MFIVFHFVFSEDLLFLNSLFNLEIKSEGWINFFTGMGYEDILAEAVAQGEEAVSGPAPQRRGPLRAPSAPFPPRSAFQAPQWKAAEPVA